MYSLYLYLFFNFRNVTCFNDKKMDEDTIKAKLKDVPCSFMIKDVITTKPRKILEQLIRKLQEEHKTNICDLEEEIIRDYNLLSYLFWCTGDKTEAFEYSWKALEKADSNATAIVNQIWFYVESHDPYEAQKSWDKFVGLTANPRYDQVVLTAEAEIAYCYTRLGFRQYEKAVTKFTDVLSKASQIRDMDQTLVYLWKVGLGLTLRRLSHVGNVQDEAQMQATKDRLKEAVRVFVDVVQAEWFSKRCRAFAYVQLALVAQSVKMEKLEVQEYFPDNYRYTDIGTFYKEAELLCKNDTYTLERYGKYLRNERQFDDAERTLRASIAIMPTSTAHHFLALILKSKLHKEVNEEQKKPFSRSLSSPEKRSYGRNTTPYHRQASSYAAVNKEKHVRNLFQDKMQGSDDARGRVYSKGSQEDSTCYSCDSGFYSTRISNSSILKDSGAMGGFTPEKVDDATRNTSHTFDSGFGQSLSDKDSIGSLSKALQNVSLEDSASGSVREDQNRAQYLTSNESREGSQVQSTREYNPKRHFQASSPLGRKHLPNIRILMKSPTKVLPLPKEDERTKEILYHLNKAIELGENRAAKYDKGLILRAVEDYDDAISVFQGLFAEETSLMYLANAYEQCAFCLNSKIEKHPSDSEAKQKLIYNQKWYLKKSIAISTKMVSRMPTITDIWSAGTTLKNILTGEGKSKENLKELALLSTRLKEYKEAIGYYQEVMQMDESEQRNPELLMQIAKNQMDAQNFSEAVSLFDLINMIRGGKEFIDHRLYITALVEAGFEAIQRKSEALLGSEYLKTVLFHSFEWNEYAHDPVKSKPPGAQRESFEEDEENFDIVILCHEDNTTAAIDIMKFLKDVCRIKVTVNKQDIVLGRLELSAMLSLISQTKTVIICYDKPCSQDADMQVYIEQAIKAKSYIVTILMQDDTKTPVILERFPSLIYKTQANIEWMKALFFKFAKCLQESC